ncbi:hypothetical protein AXG93_879s1160 [Marchantia polymorpha subsp. ruderalis]|uniref:Uncharacterized protein n=1 Tax=Marchantia polymorpha subsp. ruderalis TaxID=1480154 RepID=A0A176WUF9_MARPO|nr:hypothetical protein AXG93_879s1160 [Marchantia polymorpha subsp. ruderalis]
MAFGGGPSTFEVKTYDSARERSTRGSRRARRYFGRRTQIGFNATDMLGKRVISLLRYLDRKLTKYVEPIIAGYYIELVRCKTAAKVATSVVVAERVASLTFECMTVKSTLDREKRLRQLELECAELQRSLVAKKYLHTKTELEYVGIWVDLSNA